MMLLPVHIFAGLVALAAGAVAMSAAKGGTLHRKSGWVFVVAMLVLTSSAVVMATFFSPNPLNVVAGMVTFYLVATSLLTVRRPVDRMRGLATGMMVLALVAGVSAIGLGVAASASPDHRLVGMPPPPFHLFGVVALLGAIGDARMLRDGAIQGSRRIARHLWRMSFAMWIATMSFFLGQARHFPEAIRHSGLLSIPVVLVLLVMLYWLGRVFIKRRGVAYQKA